MATFKSDKVSLHYPAEKVFDKLSNLENLKSVLANMPKESIPSEQLQALNQVKVTSDSISLPAGPVGEITLRVSRKEPPAFIKLIGENSPVPLSLSIEIDSTDSNSCDVTVIFELEIPAMLKPMVSGPLNKMSSQFAEMIKLISFD